MSLSTLPHDICFKLLETLALDEISPDGRTTKNVINLSHSCAAFYHAFNAHAECILRARLAGTLGDLAPLAAKLAAGESLSVQIMSARRQHRRIEAFAKYAGWVHELLLGNTETEKRVDACRFFEFEEERADELGWIRAFYTYAAEGFSLEDEMTTPAGTELAAVPALPQLKALIDSTIYRVGCEKAFNPNSDKPLAPFPKTKFAALSKDKFIKEAKEVLYTPQKGWLLALKVLGETERVDTGTGYSGTRRSVWEVWGQRMAETIADPALVQEGVLEIDLEDWEVARAKWALANWSALRTGKGKTEKSGFAQDAPKVKGAQKKKRDPEVSRRAAEKAARTRVMNKEFLEFAREGLSGDEREKVDGFGLTW